jgi:DNA invertase Pin-like site-specific DNA recombinase
MRTTDSDVHVGIKVGGYVRVSTFEQAEKGTSISEQKRIIHEECLKRGWQLVQIYCDEGASGKLTARKGLRDLQSGAKMGLFQTIMVTKSDRLTRSIRDLSNLWHEWTELGLEIISVEQPEISSKGIYGKMLRNLLGIFAEWERDSIIERTTSGRMARWRKTEAIMGSLPYGYEFDRNNQRIVLHPEKAIICKRIFKMYLHQKIGAREIALRLSNASIPTPRGKKCLWHFETILKILKNPAYAGKSELNRYKIETLMSRNDQQYRRRSKEKKDRSQWITIEFPPIISKESHRMILDRMKLNSSLLFKRGDRCYGKFFLLENIYFFCGECGTKMVIHVSRNGNRPSTYYTYYRCRRNAMSRMELASINQSHCRCDMRVDAHTLDNFVFGQIMELLSSIVSVAHLGLKELNLQKIIERAQNPLNTLSSKQVSECYRIAGWELKKCNESDLKYIKKACQGYSINSNLLKNNHDSEIHRYDQDNQFAVDYLKINSSRMIRQEPINLSTDISYYIDALTFEQKKRVIESMISPASGGKCIIRWAKPSEIANGFEELPSPKRDRFSSGAFRNEPQIIEMTLFTDLSRIQALIWGTGMGVLSQPLHD